jgi:hypothetical protein
MAKHLFILIILGFSFNSQAATKCSVENAEKSLDRAITYFAGISCLRSDYSDNDVKLCLQKQLLANLLVMGTPFTENLTNNIADGIWKKGNDARKNILRLKQDIATLGRYQRAWDVNLVTVHNFKELQDNVKATGMILDRSRPARWIIQEKVEALKDYRILEKHYANKAELILKGSRAVRAAAYTSALALSFTELKGSAQCPIQTSLAVTEVDENCNPIPHLGSEELYFLELSPEEKAQKLKTFPELCSHFEEIAKNLEQKLEIMRILYTEGNSITNVKCEGNKVSYKLKGNPFIGDAEITSRYSTDKKSQGMEFSIFDKVKKNFTVDYADAGGHTVINAIKWESSDPQDTWNGSRSILRTQLGDAHIHPEVEKAIAINMVHQNLGKNAASCCFENKNCPATKNSSKKSNNQKKSH